MDKKISTTGEAGYCSPLLESDSLLLILRVYFNFFPVKIFTERYAISPVAERRAIISIVKIGSTMGVLRKNHKPTGSFVT